MLRAVSLASLLALVACTPAVPPSQEAPAFEPLTEPLEGIVDDAASLRRHDNDARRDAVVALLEREGFEPRLHAFPNDADQPRDTRARGHNVVVSIGEGEPALVAGAHFDAVYLRDGGFSDGMVDNAAGVVVLVHAARALRDAPLARRIDFVFFDMEEIGLVGSRHYARSLPPDSVAAMYNVDVAAYGDTLFYGNTADGHDALYDEVRQACFAQRLTCIDFPRAPPSDNLSFARVGIPHVGLSVLPRAEVFQLWLLMHGGDITGLADGFRPDVIHTIHTEHDTVERLDAAAMTLAYNVLTAMLLEAAQ